MVLSFLHKKTALPEEEQRDLIDLIKKMLFSLNRQDTGVV
tara:strand:- start:155 stop:274 length:120 start_codon:yes stop_codon:yes gene_type:complete